MIKNLKKETTLFVFIMVFASFLIIPQVTGASFLDILNQITGRATTQSLGIAVQTNSIPVIGNVTVYNAPIDVIENGNTSIFISFVVTDGDGLSNIDNESAMANISRSGETTRYNDSDIDGNLGGCVATGNVGVNGKNFTCNISIVFYDGAGSWDVRVRVNDSNAGTAQNTTVTFSINELTALVIFPNSISFPTVGLTDVNVSGQNNLTINNTGNDDISGRESSGEYINITALMLLGETDASTHIPTHNFSIGTDVTNTPQPSYCDVSRTQNTTRLVNHTAALSNFNNFSAGINGSFIDAAAAVNTETLSVCFLDVPDDLTSQNYSSGSTSWTVLIW